MRVKTTVASRQRSLCTVSVRPDAARRHGVHRERRLAGQVVWCRTPFLSLVGLTCCCMPHQDPSVRQGAPYMTDAGKNRFSNSFSEYLSSIIDRLISNAYGSRSETVRFYALDSGFSTGWIPCRADQAQEAKTISYGLNRTASELPNNTWSWR